ncbi:MAG: SGNH/GDSL hydrolase family protein [Lachnospiraceae bacterium]
MKQQFLKKLMITALSIMSIVAMIVYIIDPFYHYHKPIGFLKAVSTKAEYQVIGTIKNFEYNSILVGSSVAENYNSKWFDEAFHTTTIKTIRAGGTTSDLMYFINKSYEYQTLDYIFYSLDLAALISKETNHFVQEGMPTYLYNKNPFDDIQYLLNKDVLLEDIPHMIAKSLIGDYDEGEAYNWAQYKTFNTMHYEKTTEKKEMQDVKELKDAINFNNTSILNLVKEHQETKFIFIIPPYSYLWWFEAYQNGLTESYFYALESLLGELLVYENVSFYYFQTIEEIVTDLDKYMDPIHFDQDINEFIVSKIKENKYLLTIDSYQKEINSMRQLADKCVTVYAEEYFKTLK